jgi:hypothetical protein
MGRRKSVRKNGWQEEYACRRLLGAVLAEAVLDALSEKGVRWQDRTSALAFLRDANVQALCDAHLALPPDLWRAFAEAADQGVEIDYAMVEGLGSDRLLSASPAKQSKPLTQQSATLAGQTKTLTGQSKASASQPARRASSPRKRRSAGESHGQAGAPPAVIVVAERTFTPESTAEPASPSGFLGLMRRIQQAVGRPAAAGAG